MKDIGERKVYKYILFDLDGTLTRSEFGIITAARYALGKFGIEEPDREKLLRFIGPPLYVSFHDYYGLEGDDVEQAVRYFQKIYETETYKDAPLFGGVREMLQHFRDAGKTLMVVTSKPREMAVKVIEHTEISGFFEHIVGPEREMKNASKAALIENAMKLEPGSKKTEFIMVGDRHYDIDAAVEAGIDSIGVVYGYGSIEELKAAGATYIAHTPLEICNL